MESLLVENQFVLLRGVELFYRQHENKEMCLPAMYSYFAKHSSQFLSASEFEGICKSLFIFTTTPPSYKPAPVFDLH